jgi:hypothetical protein
MSTQSSDKNKRIAKNTLLVYFHMLFMMVVFPNLMQVCIAINLMISKMLQISLNLQQS